MPQTIFKLLKTSGFAVAFLTAAPLAQTDFPFADNLEFNVVEIEAFEIHSFSFPSVHPTISL